jgi:addiction module HigA family antidote
MKLEGITMGHAIPPGEILRRDFLAPLGLSVSQLARDLHIPANHLQDVVAGKRAIKADLALRLGRYFGVNPETWLTLQAGYDLHVAEREFGKKIEELIMPLEAA